MLKTLLILGGVALLAWIGWSAIGWFRGQTSHKPEGRASSASLYDRSFTAIDGGEVRLDSFRGKAILFVNVASKCGNTPQYEGLEELYAREKERLVVIGFPANDFLGQESGSDEEIAAFCRLTYGVTFPMASKTSVVGEGKHPIYRWLTDPSLNGWNSAEPKWNFHKYLVSETGELVAVFPPSTQPESEEILAALN